MVKAMVVAAVSVVVRVATDIFVMAMGVLVRRAINGIGNGSIWVVVESDPAQAKLVMVTDVLFLGVIVTDVTVMGVDVIVSNVSEE
jgi:hypothetical protein